MKKVAFIALAALCIMTAQAKTYTINSGKWTDSSIWGDEYIGSTIHPDDEVIITGQVTLNTPILVQGKLQVQRGASLVGMKDLFIAKNGTFTNYGNTVVRSITNDGILNNYLSLEAMNNIQTTGHMMNNSYILAGNDFDSRGGSASGRGGRIYANNEASVSASTSLSIGLSVLAVKKKE